MDNKTLSALCLKRRAPSPIDDDDSEIGRKQQQIEKACLTDDTIIHMLRFIQRNSTSGLKNLLKFQMVGSRLRNLIEHVNFSKLKLKQIENSLLMNGVVVSIDDLEMRINFFLTCFIRVSVLDIRFEWNSIAVGNWWTNFGTRLQDSGKMRIKSLTVRSTFNDDRFYGPASLMTWITDLIKSNRQTLRRLNVPASLIPLDCDWHLSYLRLKFLYNQPRRAVVDPASSQPRQQLRYADFMQRIKTVNRLCVDGCLCFSGGAPVNVVRSDFLIHPFYLSANALKVRRLEVMWPRDVPPKSYLTMEQFLRQVQTLSPKGAPPNCLSSVRVFGGHFALSRTFLDITNDRVKCLFFAIAMKSVMPFLRRVDWTLVPHASNPCKADFDTLVRCANHLFVMLADFGGNVTLLCDPGEVMIAKDLLLYTMLNGPGFAGAKLDIYTKDYVVFLSKNRKLTVRIYLK